MSQLGERLRLAREQKGISLAQAAAETRIRQQSLAALEEGFFERIPNDVVVKGFLRNYAQFLDMSPDEMVDLYRQENGTTRPIQVMPASTMPRTRLYVLPSFLMVFFVTLALAAFAYYALNATGLVQNDRPSAVVAEQPTATAAIPTPTALPTELPPAVEPAAPAAPTAATVAGGEPAASNDNPVSAPTNPPTPSPSPTLQVLVPELQATGVATPTSVVSPTPTPAAPIVVQVAVTDTDSVGSWLRVTTDNAVVYEQIMQPGEQQIFLAQRQVVIRSGNPTVVQVSVNGAPPEPLGEVPGEPIDWFWPPQ